MLTQDHTHLQTKVLEYLKDAHALEQNVLRMLNGMIATTTDPQTLSRLRQHYHESEEHEQLVRNRIQSLGGSVSTVRDAAAIGGAWIKGLLDMLRVDKPGKNARDGYVTEHVEIAAYSLLEKLAEQAGDSETAQLARRIRQDEETMAHWIADRWGTFISATLSPTGIPSLSHRLAGMFSGNGDHSSEHDHDEDAETSSSAVSTLVGAAAVGLGCYLLMNVLSTGSSNRR